MMIYNDVEIDGFLYKVGEEVSEQRVGDFYIQNYNFPKNKLVIRQIIENYNSDKLYSLKEFDVYPINKNFMNNNRYHKIKTTNNPYILQYMRENKLKRILDE